MSTRPSVPAPGERRAGSLGVGALAVLVGLLAGPVLALSRLTPGIDGRVLAGGAATVSLCTYLAYLSDKRRAESGAWRISESALHLGELLGGWPGAFLAQRKFRHKTAKASYQFIFWLIVALHQAIAFDALLGGRFANAAWRLLRAHLT